MTTFDFEGEEVPVEAGDTVASALFRAGVRTFSRSFEYHRRRGLHCLTGDCPNCLVNVDGEPSVRACTTPAEGVQAVRRQNGWPSVDWDVLSIADRLRFLLPVGFYYKTMLRPRWLWPRLEPLVRKVAGLGEIDLAAAPRDREARHLHPDVLVIGAGVAGLAAALAATEAGLSVVICDEGRVGEAVPPGPTRRRIGELRRALDAARGAVLLERAAAIGIYEGPLVPVNAGDFLQLVHPGRVIVATGAVERHAVFPGSDLPGVWLGRGAARMAGVHGIAPARRAVLAGASHELEEQAETLRAAGVDVIAVDAAEVERATGRRRVRAAVVHGRGRIRCDAIVLSPAFQPRDGLLRQGEGLPVVGAGQVVLPNCSLEEAEESGRRAVLGAAPTPLSSPLPAPPREGIVCLCEDVTVDDLDRAWAEGFRSLEILKRYTTATMGPCQGILCQAHVRSYVAARMGGGERHAPEPTTARPPARAITLEQAAAGERAERHHETALHRRHLELGATTEPSGAWRRPERYGDLDAEYWAVRRNVGVMDVGTLGKFLVGGRDALAFLEQLYPCHVHDLEPGRLRYALLLGQHGYVVDDGLICALGDGRFYLTFTTGGAEAAEANLRDWIETWRLDVHLVNRTAATGAISVSGPRARELLGRLSGDAVDREALPYLRHREIEVAGVPCRALRLGFVGELSYELHHPSSRSVELWDALLSAGEDLGVRPHGLETLRLLRLEKGHVIVGQDTDYDSTPAKLGMDWAVRWDKPSFVGRTALGRTAEQPLRRRLLALRFSGATPAEGTPLRAGGQPVGHLTSCRFSPVLGHPVGLGWSVPVDGAFPTAVDAGGTRGVTVDGPFYDPEGARVRA